MNRTYWTKSTAGPASFFMRAARMLVCASVTTSLAFGLTACGQTTIATPDTGGVEAAVTSEGQATTSEAAAFSIDASALFSDRDLDASYNQTGATKVMLADAGSQVEGTGATANGGEITITAGGTYIVSGSLQEGRIVVDVPDSDKVQVVFDGATINSSDATVLYVKSADKVFLTLAAGSHNSLAATGADITEDDHTLDGAIFAADDLTINGEGTLSIASTQGAGIVAKDELTVCGGTLSVTGATHAIAAKDSFAACAGNLTLTAQRDGIHVSHDTNGEKGFCYISGGTYAIEAADDGIHATNDILVDGGTLTISAEGDGIHSEYDLIINDGTIDVTKSNEGLEGARIEQNGGTVTVKAQDDGLNATGDPTDADGTGEGFEPMGDGKGMRPEMNGGMPEGIPEPPEGFEPPQGEMDASAAPEDATQGQEGGTEGFGNHRGQRLEGFGDTEMPDMGQMPAMGGGFGVSDSASLIIRGGRLVVDADGDGIDSNGTIEIAGGEVFVSGPTNNGNSAIDFGTSAVVTGGILVASGSAGMVERFSDDSAQGVMLVTLAGEGGDTITLTDASGTVLATHTATKRYECVVLSAPAVSAGNTYTVSNGTESKEVSMESVTYSDVTRGMGGPSGRGDESFGQGGMVPDGVRQPGADASRQGTGSDFGDGAAMNASVEA